ncbi:hypothetical protein AQEC111735_12105 [Aquirufa ecclesiirivi]
MAVPELMTTLLLVTAVPVAGVNVKVPVPTVPVKVKAPVILATPLTKRPTVCMIFPPANPETVPLKLVVTVTLFCEASNEVKVFPYASCAVTVLVPVKAVPLICGLAKLTANLLKLASETVTDKRSPPVDEILPSVVETTAASALYNFKLAVATPLLKVTTVAVPKFTSLAFLSVTVGAVTGLEELKAPENVNDLSPV